MSFAGHVADMINRVRYNESLKKGIRSRYSRIKKEYYDKLHCSEFRSFKDKTLSADELKSLQIKIRKEIIKERKKQNIISSFLLVVSLIVAVAVIYITIQIITADYRLF
ncbi:MAG: hypothetical protein R6U11_07770 [Bacteroidales bacterium]